MLDGLLQKTYNFKEGDLERTICILVRDFESRDSGDRDYMTTKSIITQNYKNWQMVYLSEKNDASI